MNTYENAPHGTWYCKIGEAGVLHETGLDLPMRNAVAKAYREVTGQENDFIFSGWRTELTEQERAVVEDRLPDPDKVTHEISGERLRSLEEASKFLDALQAAGVNNWEGYSDAFKIMDGEDPSA